MPQQLIYTSAPRGVIAGRSGHCTVARSAAMRDALMLQLEKLSYYQHLSLTGGQERPIYCCRILDLRGSRYHVLTRIQDAGLDFTGRTNFIAHHLVFAPEEIRQFASPPIVLGAWPGWVEGWNKDPELLEKEDWSSLAGLAHASMPAANWQQLTGDGANAYGLLEARVGSAFRVDDIADEQVLTLFAESLELLELRDARHDFRATAWQYTFTTSMQEQDNPADFRWRCLHSDNPAANRFAAPDTRALSEVRVQRVTDEEAMLARGGKQSPRFIEPPQSINSIAGETARLCAKAEGMPVPAYQWFTVDRSGKNQQPIAGATNEELLVTNPPMGISRYVVRATNSEGEITSEIVTLSVETKAQAASRPTATTRGGSSGTGPHIRTPEEIERQRQRLQSEEEQGKKPFRKWPFITLGILFIGVAGGAIALLSSGHKKSTAPTAQRHDTNLALSNLARSSNASVHAMKTPVTTTAPTNPPSAAFSTAKTKEPAVPFSDNLPQLPAPWAARRIGNLPTATWASYNTNAFIVHGSGQSTDPKTDNLFLVQRAESNSIDFTSRVKTADQKNASRQGIMLRDSVRADASFGFVGLSQKSIIWAHRDVNAAPCQFMPVSVPPLPVYLRLVRRTNSISGAYSTDGSNWIWLGTNQITFSQPEYLAGLAVSSGTALWTDAVFDQVSIKHLKLE
jgi:hypothetical protein